MCSKVVGASFHALLNAHSPSIDLLPGRKQLAGQLRGLWFHAGELTVPPRSLDEARNVLNLKHRKRACSEPWMNDK